MKKKAKDLVIYGATVGVGSHALSNIPNTAHARTALSNLSSFTPMTSNIIGAGEVLGTVRKLTKKKW